MAKPLHERLQAVDYGELTRRITRLRTMDTRTLSQAQIDERVRRVLDGYHTVEIKVVMNGLYRARRNIGDAPFQSTADLWYPPAAAIVARGRFNEPHAAMFYACNRAASACAELRLKVGDVVTILIIKSKSNVTEINCAHIGLEKSLAPELTGSPRKRMLRNNPKFQEYLQHHGITSKWLAIDDFLGEMATSQFAATDEQEKYRITNAISRPLLQIPDVEALNYPSVAGALKALNICMPHLDN